MPFLIIGAGIVFFALVGIYYCLDDKNDNEWGIWK